MRKINWSICDDAEYLCLSFEIELKKYKDLNYLGYATTSDECLKMVENNKPDILLLDIQMETETAGIDLLPRLKELSPKTKIIILTSYDNDNYIYSAFVNHADDYILKNLPSNEIYKTIINVYNNTSMLRPEIAQKLVAYSHSVEKNQQSLLYILEIMSKLSNSEFDILKLVYSGYKYKQIAEMRVVEICTVRTLASRIINKFGVPTMEELIADLSKLKVFEFINSYDYGRQKKKKDIFKETLI